MDYSKQAVEQVPSPPFQWQKAVHQIIDLMTITILALSVTTCLAILAYRASDSLLLLLAQTLASVAVLLHVGMGAMLTRLVVHAAVTWRCLQSGGKHTVQSKQLRKAIMRVARISLMTWIWNICMMGFPFTLPLVNSAPETGILLTFLLGLTLIYLLMKIILIKQAYGQLLHAITTAEQVARRTFVV
ncbi:hypothetical protein XACN24_07830 [Xanthomonas albilineans]|uniref:Transmembrane protein n=1 Tax=Xanthomonas albilineans (strain GPE PC73 / CFBP 7063) TaxID=380358 RepID=D2UDS1_XANAP|nr:hypothetical protein [Xanthomonas albilineans]QHQ28350.1 hypothetical protein XaFJ1_GM001608 [Xanthomonas albilineans]CBA16120.1 hypothetical protein XALC_1621 [Xanthomonas albilineans GPE PC73]